jgi:hypothetical protein
LVETNIYPTLQPVHSLIAVPVHAEQAGLQGVQIPLLLKKAELQLVWQVVFYKLNPVPQLVQVLELEQVWQLEPQT